jgi:fatty-acyl-CoA synthase
VTIGSRFRTYVEDILDVLAAHPEDVVVIHDNQRLTASEFAGLVRGMAHALMKAGVDTGETVTLLAGSGPGTIAARYAANLIGCKVNQLYSRISTVVQARIMQDVGTRVLIVDPRHADRGRELAAALPIETVLTLGSAGIGTDLCVLAQAHRDTPIQGRAEPQGIAVIRHTGGTTGHPKGIALSFETLNRKLTISPTPEMAGRRFLACTSLAHAASQGIDRTLRSGGTVILHDDFDPRRVLETIQREAVTHLYVLPPMLYRLVDEPSNADTSSLREIYYMGSPASPERLLDAVERFGPVLRQIYALTEAGNISALGPDDHDPRRPELLNTVGRVLPGVEIAIRDSNDGELPRGEPGEICVRSSSVMEGYWAQPELTAQVLRGGWLHTGDVGYLDENGYLTLVDRLSDKIIVLGGHVHPAEVEKLLDSHPAVAQSVVVGVPGADRFEHVHAVVVTASNQATSEMALRAYVAAEYGPMYEPESITFVTAVPLTEAGKVDRRRLREQAMTA